jgi:hypothetical protein
VEREIGEIGEEEEGEGSFRGHEAPDMTASRSRDQGGHELELEAGVWKAQPLILGKVSEFCSPEELGSWGQTLGALNQQGTLVEETLISFWSADYVGECEVERELCL